MTMTDRQLLELAAKSIGISGYFHPAHGMVVGYIRKDDDTLDVAEWSPITNDADAFRLAGALKIDVIHNDPQDNSPWVMANGFHAVEDVEDESHRLAATRRAITRAAAEIQLARERA